MRPVTVFKMHFYIFVCLGILLFSDLCVVGSSVAPPAPCSVSPCMYGSAAQYHHSQEALLPHQSGAEVRDMVSSLPPINTVFMGSTGGPP